MTNDLRVITHRKLAPVGRLMGYTPGGLVRLCSAITDTWSAIGLTKAEASPVYASRPNWWHCEAWQYDVECDCIGEIHGSLVFSIGTQRFNARESELFRLEIERDIARQVGKALKPRTMRIAASDGRGMNGPVTRLVSPLAPRDHRG